MVLLHFRLTDDSQPNLEEVTTWLRSVSKVYLCVLESGSITGKQHTHCVHDFPKTKSTFGQNFLKKFPRYKGNQSYSCETLKKELENNIRYLCKGTKDILPQVLFSSYSDEEIKLFHEQYWSENKKVVKEKNKTISWSQQLTQDIQNEYPQSCNFTYCAVDIQIITRRTLLQLGATSKKLNHMIVRDLVLGQLNALNKYSLHEDIYMKAFPDLYGN